MWRWSCRTSTSSPSSTESTSVLTDTAMIGEKKTRAMAGWAERRGFTTSLQERMFAADFKRQADEPAVALCGLDNAEGRRALDQVGFDFSLKQALAVVIATFGPCAFTCCPVGAPQRTSGTKRARREGRGPAGLRETLV